MTKKQRADFVRKELDKLYPKVPIFLHHTDAYTLLVAVALSAQTTDKKVNEITPELFRVAGTPQAMARLEVAEIKDLIKEIGDNGTETVGSLVVDASEQEKAWWITYNNFCVVTRYNASPLYAMAVGELADRIRHKRESKLRQ